MPEAWMAEWGLWAVLVGSILEGEAVLVAAGYAVSQGYLPPAATFAFAVLGGTLGDHLYYLAGRLWGGRILARFAGLRPVRARMTLILRRWGRRAAFAIRFAYGLRAVLPLSMGSARYPALLFLPFNVLGAVAFAALYLSVGYFFGEVVEDLVGRMHGVSTRILVAILAVGGLLWIVREWRLFHPSPGAAGEGEEEGEADAPAPGEG